MKKEEKMPLSPQSVTRHGRYNSVGEALEAKKKLAKTILKGVDLKKLTSL